MTNICGLCILTRKHGKTVQVQRQDGKILAILVEEVLQKFPGAGLVRLPAVHHHHLPLTYKLKLGNMYYKSTPKDDQGSSYSKRIKVVITKQQLQQLVSTQISLHNAPKQYWRPHLHSIPE